MDTDKLSKENDINLLDYLIVILKHKSFILKAAFGAMIIAAVISLMLPSIYKAETKILPPQKSGSSMAYFATQMSGMGISPSMLGMKDANSLYVSLLKTKPVLDYVIKNLDLLEKFETESKDAARKILSADLRITDDKRSGIIAVGYEHRNPKIAADIANAFINGLRNLNNSLAVTEASQRRLFFEEQLKYAKNSLIKSEESLQNFQQKTGTIKIDEQAKAAIEETSLIRAKISGKEVGLRVMKTYATSQNPDLQKLENEIAALKEQLSKLESKNIGDDSLFSTGKLSVLGAEYIRKMRDFKYNETLYEILMKQYGAAKLDEASDASIVQVVEIAEVPEKRFKPSRRKIVVNTGLIVFFLSIFLVFMKVYYENLMADSASRSKIKDLKKSIDFEGMKLKFFSILKKNH
ncbi:MAG: Wzz/FepE/Etk N-terminal domain-containing protein [Elusimicrobia bacterium]|nr:Wzz/FepE/Etk N-terminal domain-containing protein [Elusimicrobiota bacterium]